MKHSSPEQYRLAAEIGQTVMDARARGVSWADIATTLRQSASLAEDRSCLDVAADQLMAWAGAAVL